MISSCWADIPYYIAKKALQKGGLFYFSEVDSLSKSSVFSKEKLYLVGYRETEGRNRNPSEFRRGFYTLLTKKE
jgi:hypothetical protein